jgi:ArsR family transcriptional regulator
MAALSALASLKALADPTRLRLLALLDRGEATVGELVEVLGQSQPRVSRHLRILSEAGLVSHFRDGQWMYYCLERSAPAAVLAARTLDLARSGDPLFAADEVRMGSVRRGRERYAFAAASGPLRRAGAAAERPAESMVQQVLDDVLGRAPLGDVLDVGVGSGALLRLLAARARSAVGVDVARGMRVLARTRLQQAGLGHCATVRAGDLHALPFADLSFDLVVLDEVLALSPRPQTALAEALRVLRPLGRLLIFDRILPAARRLPGERVRDGLYENQLLVMLRAQGLHCTRPVWFPGRSPDHAVLVAGLPAAVSTKEIA